MAFFCTRWKHLQYQQRAFGQRARCRMILSARLVMIEVMLLLLLLLIRIIALYYEGPLLHHVVLNTSRYSEYSLSLLLLLPAAVGIAGLAFCRLV